MAVRAVPRVTVLIPNYNGGRYLRECLTSLQSQTFDGWQGVVGDNASNDDSVSIVRSLPDPRVRLVERPHTVSAVANFNLLVAEIDTEYAVILTADDWWEPTFLERMMPLLDNHPESLMAACAVRVMSNDRPVEVLGLHQLWPPERGTSCPPAETLKFLVSKRNRLYLPAILTRRELYHRFPRYEESMVSDWLMAVRCAAVAPVQVCPEPLVNYRHHDESTTARAERAHLWGLELVKALKLLQSEWAGVDLPFSDARRMLARSFTLKLLDGAYRKILLDDRSGALFYLELARAVAPSAVMRAFAFWCEKVAWLWTTAPLGRAGRPALGLLQPLEDHLRKRW